MTLWKLLPLLVLAALTLAACGDEEEVTQAPTPPVAEAPAPEVAEPAEAPPAAVTTAPVETDTQVASVPPPAATTAEGEPLERFQERTYTAGPVSIRFDPDGTFEMNETEGDQKVEGRYALEDGIVTFSEPTGDVGAATFPLRCRFEPAEDAFTLGAVGDSCARFEGLTFQPAS